MEDARYLESSIALSRIFLAGTLVIRRGKSCQEI